MYSYFYTAVTSKQKRLEQNEVDFQEIMLKDTDSHATVAVWDKMVNTLQKNV